MSKQTESNLFITSSIAAFYKQLLSGITNYQELGNRILRDIEAPHAFRQVERVRELSRILLNFPVKEYQLIAQYYLVWCKCRELKLHPEVLQRVVSESRTYKTKALLSLAGIEGLKGNFDMELYYLNGALKTSPSMPDRLQALRGIAVIKAKEGFHNTSLKDLDNIIPLLRYADPLGHNDILNSYAVELGEAGRKQEARNIIQHVVASPFAPAYPEWQETADELREPNRAFISVPQIEYKPVEIEETEDHQASEPKQPAKLIAFKLKEAPPPEKPERVTAQELDTMTTNQKREVILAALRSGAIPESEYNKLIFMCTLPSITQIQIIIY
jgi:hypothetical protein